ncbi:hypothetical protein AVEN_135117-1 [Araneus ventricosus]|uniref:DM10 domain-containing protein n=1 Tax=Araneus ventricosus TaxID=182803 RepID=A0A4Y2D9Q4_ARAVE|nr:hypothetical protein AVEN_135117-1 [Araneus ventricosus]
MCVKTRLKRIVLKAALFSYVKTLIKGNLSQVTPLRDDKMRRFVVTFYPCDDTVSINEESIQNSGFPGGAFLKRSRVPKPDTGLSVKPEFYSAADFYIGAEIRACGKLFALTDADRFVLTFMEQHPEIYPSKIYIHSFNTQESQLDLLVLDCRLRGLFWYGGGGWVPHVNNGTQPNRGYQNRPLTLKEENIPAEI